ncbi:MAG: hypothetical protein SV422_04600, partial [Pseudomonadota bacterium]|nr:hypothetical protein [Pseudomonadota bacterium]
MRQLRAWLYTATALSAAIAGTAQAQDIPDALVNEWPLFEDYCMDCHSFDDFRGGLALEGMRPEDIHDKPEVFEKVLRKLKIGAMPPRDQDQPD